MRLVFILTALLAAGCGGKERSSGGGAGGTGGSGADAGQGGTGGALPAECTLVDTITLDSTPYLMPVTPIRTDGQYVYFVGLYGALQRVPVNGGAPELLHESTAAFALSGTSAIYATYLGELGEVTGPGQSRRIAGEHKAKYMAADATSVYFSEGQTNDHGSLFSLDLDALVVSSFLERSIGVGMVEVTRDALYWSEAPTSDGAARVVRSPRESADPVVVADGVDERLRFAVDEDTLAIATSSGLSVGPATGGARSDLITDQDVRDVIIVDGQLYFSRTDACVTDPNFGNGTAVCQGKIFRVAKDGTALELVLDTQGPALSLSADARCIYWVEVDGQCHPGCSGALHAAPRNSLRN